MKKLALAVATSALGAYATAATVTEFANGVLVPYAMHDGASDTTAVGLTSCAAGTVYWTFFDVNTKHITDGQFNMTENDQYGFIWSEESGLGLENTTGYLVFVMDNAGLANALDSSDQPCLAGNAFQIQPDEEDVAYLPVLPLQAKNPSYDETVATLSGDFGDADASGVFVPNLLDMNEDSVAALAAGANAGDSIYLRYFIDGATTDIVVWTTDRPGDDSGRVTVNMYNDNQDRRSVNIEFPNTELNVIDPTAILGRPEDFVDGFIKWDIPGTATYSAVSWSVIDAPVFGAVQTVVNPIKLRNATSGANEVRVRVIPNPQP